MLDCFDYINFANYSTLIIGNAFRNALSILYPMDSLTWLFLAASFPLAFVSLLIILKVENMLRLTREVDWSGVMLGHLWYFVGVFLGENVTLYTRSSKRFHH